MTPDGNNQPKIDDDLNTTAPQSEPEAWRMPDPVFQRTSGKLPESYARDVQAFPSVETSVPPAEPSSSAASDEQAPAPDIEPKSSVLKLILVLLGLAAMTAFLIVFLTVIYFFFLRSGE